MVRLPIAHIAGIPVEETLAQLGPLLTATLAMSGAYCRRAIVRWRGPRTKTDTRTADHEDASDD